MGKLWPISLDGIPLSRHHTTPAVIPLHLMIFGQIKKKRQKDKSLENLRQKILNHCREKAIWARRIKQPNQTASRIQFDCVYFLASRLIFVLFSFWIIWLLPVFFWIGSSDIRALVSRKSIFDPFFDPASSQENVDEPKWAKGRHRQQQQ